MTEERAEYKTEPVVWAGPYPFSGAQVLELLNENERLRNEIAYYKKRVFGLACRTPFRT